MSVEGRLSKRSLQKLLSGRVKEEVAVVVKFYSNGCRYCHALRDIYEELSEDNREFEFYAFNIGDYPEVQDVLDFKGVPTFCTIKTGTLAPKIRVLEDLEKPNPESYYTKSYIQGFLDKEKK